MSGLDLVDPGVVLSRASTGLSVAPGVVAASADPEQLAHHRHFDRFLVGVDELEYV